jgi:hypothetical protein
MTTRKSNTHSSNPPSIDHNSQPPRSHTIDVLEHPINSSLSWRKNKTTHLSLQDWEQHNLRQPYHEYVHQLVAAGWENLADLDLYLTTAPSQQNDLVISVLDIDGDLKERRWPEIYHERELKAFIAKGKPADVKVRLYMAEYDALPATCVIEAFGGALKLDPRFFNWVIGSKGHFLPPSQRIRAPYTSIGFGVLNDTSTATPRKTDATRFKVLIYIQPDEEGNGWTGLILFGSHTKIALSPLIVTTPPPFTSIIPPPKQMEPISFRELYLQSFEFVDLEKAVAAPFYAISNLLRLNCFCWTRLITAIREEDHRICGISDTSVGHGEEIKKSLDVVKRGGSLGWKCTDDAVGKETREALEEDFQHLVEQNDILWQNRGKMAAIRTRRSESRWSSLTNAFTYL